MPRGTAGARVAGTRAPTARTPGKRRAAARKPALLPALLAALDARPDVTVLTRAWPVLFVQLRYVLEKTVVNPDGFSPLHRETPLFYGQAWKATRDEIGQIMGPTETIAIDGDAAAAVGLALGAISGSVLVHLGLIAAFEREPAIVGRAMER